MTGIRREVWGYEDWGELLADMNFMARSTGLSLPARLQIRP